MLYATCVPRALEVHSGVLDEPSWYTAIQGVLCQQGADEEIETPLEGGGCEALSSREGLRASSKEGRRLLHVAVDEQMSSRTALRMGVQLFE